MDVDEGGEDNGCGDFGAGDDLVDKGSKLGVLAMGKDTTHGIVDCFLDTVYDVIDDGLGQLDLE
jgi:hypothetical protein